MRRTALVFALLGTIVFAVALFVYPPQLGPWWDCRVGINSNNMLTRTRLLTSCLEDPSLTDENRATIHFKRGFAYAVNGEQERAIDDFSAAIAFHEDMRHAYYNRANSYRELGKTDLAIRDFTHALFLHPNDSSALHNRALLYIRQEKFQAALADLNGALFAKPDHVKALRTRSGLHARNGDLHAALADLNKAVDIDPSHPFSYARRARVHFELESYTQAIEDAKDVIVLWRKTDSPWEEDPLRAAFDGVNLAHENRRSYTILNNATGMLKKARSILGTSIKRKLQTIDPEKIKHIQNHVHRRDFYDGPIDGEVSNPLIIAIALCMLADRCDTDLGS